MVIKGSGVKPFDVEFRRLYAASLPVKELTVAGEPKSPPLYLGTNYLNTQLSTISSSASTRTELDEAVQRKAEPRQTYNNTVLKDLQLPNPTGHLISTAAQPRYQTAVPDPDKALPLGPLAGPGPRYQQSPGPSPPSFLPPRNQWLLIQRHSSFPKDHGVSALPWRPVVTANNNHHRHILAGVPQTARWPLMHKYLA